MMRSTLRPKLILLLMPRHTFQFPAHIRNAVRQYVRQRIASVDPRRFNQEANYVAALAQALQGTAYRGKDGSIVFRGTVVDDRGRNSAERQFGADLAITAEITSPYDQIAKAILVQAKLGLIEDLTRAERAFLDTQIGRMQRVTRSPKVMEIVESQGVRTPRMISGNKIAAGESYRPMDLPEYLTARVLPTLDGDTRPDFVAAVQDSSLSQLHAIASLT